VTGRAAASGYSFNQFNLLRRRSPAGAEARSLAKFARTPPKDRYVPLSTEEKILVETRVANEAKSIVLAYLLLFFVGYLGGHRFYLGRPYSAVTQLILFLLGWVLHFVLIGYPMLLTLLIWLIVDAFLIPGIIQEHKEWARRYFTKVALDEKD
jgi:TM2 domain-containing membrane protein YozV